MAYKLRRRLMSVDSHRRRRITNDGKNRLTWQAISGWLHGKHFPKPDNIQALARMLNMPPHEPQYGGKTTKGVREPNRSWPDHVSGTDRLAFEEFLTLSERQRKRARELIAAFTDAPVRKKGA